MPKVHPDRVSIVGKTASDAHQSCLVTDDGRLQVHDAAALHGALENADQQVDLTATSISYSKHVIAGFNNPNIPGQLNVCKVDGAGSISVNLKQNQSVEDEAVAIVAGSLASPAYSTVTTLPFTVKQMSVTVLVDTSDPAVSEPMELGMVMSTTASGGTQFPIYNSGADSYQLQFSEVGTDLYAATLVTGGPIARHVKFINRDTNAVTLADVLITYSQA